MRGDNGETSSSLNLFICGFEANCIGLVMGMLVFGSKLLKDILSFLFCSYN